MLDDAGLGVLVPSRTFATVDHIVPTDTHARPLRDAQAEEMLQAIEANTKRHGIQFFNIGSGHQGIVHVIGPELGLTQPGHHDRVRRQPHLDARGVRRDRVRHRHEPGARRARDRSVSRWRARRCAASRCRARSAWRVREGRHPARDSPARREGRRRLRVRVRGRRDRAHDHGRAHDPLQHVDRGRRARWLREPRRHHLRLSARPPLRAAGRRIRARDRLVAQHGE